MDPSVRPAAPVLPSRPSSVPRTLPPPLPPRKQNKPVLLHRTSQERRFVDGMTNEQVEVLLRRFDKQIPWVKIVPSHSPRISSIPPLLDLQPSPEEEFAPEKLRSNVERLYSTVIVGTIRAVSEVIRLRSWDNGLRTGTFLAVYIVAWTMHLVTASLLSFVSILVLFPSSRSLFFPVQQTIAQTKLSESSPTKFPSEMTEEERVEAQASQFATDLEELAEIGLKPSWATDEEEADVTVERAREVAGAQNDIAYSDVKVENAEGNRVKTPKKEKAQKKMPIERIGRPVMMVCGDLADGWERWANALSPTPPFPVNEGPRRIFLSILLPLIISTTIFSDYVFSRVTSALIGLLFFGQPVLDQLLVLLDERCPGWQEKIELRNGILAGCPTDAQLSLRLLREAELNNNPIPPPRPAPPSSVPTDTSSVDTQSINSDKMDKLDTESVAGSIASASGLIADPNTASNKEPATPSKKSEGRSKITSFLKATAKLTEESVGYASGEKKLDWNKVSKAALEKLNISPSNQAARTLLSIVPSKQDNEGPCSFLATRSGRPGWIRIDGSSITFTSIATESAPSLPEDPTLADDISILKNEEEDKKKGKKTKPPPLPPLTISANDLTAIRRFGMGGWQGRMLVSWVVGLEGVGGAGLELTMRRKRARSNSGTELQDLPEVDKDIGEEVTYKFGVVRRDELFNRLISLGNQRWEIM